MRARAVLTLGRRPRIESAKPATKGASAAIVNVFSDIGHTGYGNAYVTTMQSREGPLSDSSGVVGGGVPGRVPRCGPVTSTEATD